jgi:hypothetical protein
MEKRILIKNLIIGVLIVFLLQVIASNSFRNAFDNIFTVRISREPVFGTINSLVILATVIIGITYGSLLGAISGFFGVLLFYFSFGIFSINILQFFILFSLPYGLYGFFSGYFHKKLSGNIIGIVISAIIQSILYFILIYLLCFIHFNFNRGLEINFSVFPEVISILIWPQFSRHLLFIFPLIIIVSGLLYFIIFKQYTKKIEIKNVENAIIPGRGFLKAIGIIGTIYGGLNVLYATIGLMTINYWDRVMPIASGNSWKVFYIFTFYLSLYELIASIIAIINSKNLYKAEFLQTLGFIKIITAIIWTIIAFDAYGVFAILTMLSYIAIAILYIVGATKNKREYIRIE